MSSISSESLQNLPIYTRREEIVAAVDHNQVTIITAETGAGKSTQVPQYLAEHGYQKIIVTQPRILAARNLSTRVREEYSFRLGRDATDLVGYRTAPERDDHPDNAILYCTDGLQLVRELTGSGTRDRQVLILDEVHEWNENMEVLVAWAKKRCQEDPGFKVVLMSATIEADNLAAYYGSPAPITVTGKTFPVEKRYGPDLVKEVLAQADAGPSNMLVFLPGKPEIQLVTDILQARLTRHIPIIPLHGQLDQEAQQRAFASYPDGKIVLTTNVAQTSITIDDIDTVIDSGLERRAEVRSGVEGLFIAEISQADCLQRAGRAGRTKAGLYTLASLDKLPCAPLEQRPAYGIPEIMRKHIDRVTLRLASIGLDIEDLEFFHAPSRKTIQLAKRTLVSLGALTGTGQVTDIGRKMEHFPVESSFGRMLVESEPYPATIQAKLAAIIAIQEVGGIVKGSARYTGWRRFTRQTRSDLLAQYDVYLALQSSIDPSEYDDLGIISRNVTKAQEVNQRLAHDLGHPDVILTSIQPDETEPLLRCIVAGQLHQLWTLEPSGEVMHISSRKKRELSSGSVVRQAKLIAGTPFDLEVATAKGSLETLHLVNDVTAVDPTWLSDLAPGSFSVQSGKVYYDPHYGALATKTPIKFNGRILPAASTPLLDHTPDNQALFVQLYSAWLYDRLNHQRQAFEIYNSNKIPEIPVRQIEQRVRDLIHGAISLHELSKHQRLELEQLAQLETYLGPEYHVEPGLTQDQAIRRHKRPGRAPWKPPHQRGRRHH